MIYIELLYIWLGRFIADVIALLIDTTCFTDGLFCCDFERKKKHQFCGTTVAVCSCAVKDFRAIADERRALMRRVNKEVLGN